MTIPQDIVEAINRIVERGDYEYADNYRFYRIDNLEGLSDFQRAENSGCCGSHDEIVTVNGIEYMIGFNYGH